MCKPVSGWVTQDAVFWSKTTEAHTEIAAEYGLHIDGCRGANAVAVECSPIDKDYRLPLDQWVFRVDDAFPVPEWADMSEIEARFRVVLPDWLAAKVVLPGQKVDANQVTILANYGVVAENWAVVASNWGTVTENWGTVETYTTLPRSINAAGAVIIDRSGATVKCYVGPGRKTKKQVEP